jgi:hypothetical protein
VKYIRFPASIVNLIIKMKEKRKSLFLLQDVQEHLNSADRTVRKPQGKRPFQRPRHRREDNIEPDLRETGCENTGWIHLAQDVIHLWAF